MKITYQTEIEVTKEQYDFLIEALAEFCFHAERNGRYFIRRIRTRVYRAATELYLKQTSLKK